MIVVRLQEFNLKYFGYVKNHVMNCIIVIVVRVLGYKSVKMKKRKKNDRKKLIQIPQNSKLINTCCKSLAGEAVRMKLEMYTFTNVAIKNWQSNRSMMPPWPGIMSPKSYNNKKTIIYFLSLL